MPRQRQQAGPGDPTRTPGRYSIAGGRQGRDRLKLLSDILMPTTSRLLHDAGLAPGMHCLDVGCGGGHVALYLARQAGSEGRVVGSDIDAEILALARADAAAAALSNVEFRVADVQLDPGAQRQDLVYARFILTHLRDPAGCVDAMRRACRPGGTVVVEDIDFAGSFCHPYCAAHERYVELYQQVVRRRGGDPTIGPRLPGMLRDAGLSGIEVGLVQPVHLEGDGKRIASITMQRIADAAVAEGLADAAEVDAIVAGLDAASRDSGIVIGMPRIFQCRGRRPAGRSSVSPTRMPAGGRRSMQRDENR